MTEDDEYIPNSGEFDDLEDSDDEGGFSLNDDDWVVDELNYQLAISDVIDNYSVEQTIFSKAELADIKTKQKNIDRKR